MEGWRNFRITWRKRRGNVGGYVEGMVAKQEKYV
jgi:hypothetical protein